MASIYDLKPRFQNLLRPLCRKLASAGITANQVTIAAAVMSIALGETMVATYDATWTLFLLPVVLFARMALNAIDGMLAREFDQKSRLGAILNELGDVVSDTALYLPFAFLPDIEPALVGLVVVLAVITEMAGVVALQVGSERRYDGPFGKSDRALFFAVLGLVIAFGVEPGLWTDIVLGLAALAGALTIVNRARKALAGATP